jgi:plastocyanin
MDPQQMPPIESYTTSPSQPTSSKRRKLILTGALIVILAALAVASYLVLGGSGRSQASQEDEEHKYEATVNIDGGGFQPAVLTVRPDTRVYFESKDGQGHRLVATATPQTDHAFAEASEQGPLEQASGYAYSFHQKGVYIFHDATNPTNNGEVIVK